MLRVQADETLGGGLGSFRFGVLVVGIDQLKLGLVGVAPERIARLQCLQLRCGAGVAIIVQVFLCQLVQLDFAQVFVDDFLC